MSIADWPSAERPREKLIQRGAAALSDAELLALFLGTGVAGLSAVDLGRQMLQEFGSLRAILDADASRFCRGKGLGIARFAVLQAALRGSRGHGFLLWKHEYMVTWPYGQAAMFGGGGGGDGMALIPGAARHNLFGAIR